MRAAPQLALSSTYHPGKQVTGILRGHVAAALDFLGSSKLSGSSIHGARQEIKRARAALRLLRESIDPGLFRVEDAALRRAAQQLTDVRDCEVVLRVFYRLRDSLKEERRPPNLEPLHKLLLKEQRTAAEIARRESLASAKNPLMQVMERTRAWPVANDLDLLTAAMQRTYRQGRARYRAAFESPADDRLHAWRGQVKYSAYQLEALGSLTPARMKKRLRRCAKLARLLGRDHDLLMLHRRLSGAQLDAASRLRLDRAIECERADLQRRALELGKRLYRAKPRRFQPLN
jgi:CHAD domain-containing protein